MNGSARQWRWRWSTLLNGGAWKPNLQDKNIILNNFFRRAGTLLRANAESLLTIRLMIKTVYQFSAQNAIYTA